MNTRIIRQNGGTIAVISSSEPLLANVDAALDLIMSVQYETECTHFAIRRENIAPDFFVLRTRLAGDILQKFINYRVRLAILGDFSQEASEALSAFIIESNRMRDILFVPSEQDALDRWFPSPSSQP